MPFKSGVSITTGKPPNTCQALSYDLLHRQDNYAIHLSAAMMIAAATNLYVLLSHKMTNLQETLSAVIFKPNPSFTNWIT
jgi:hypothetical protein